MSAEEADAVERVMAALDYEVLAEVYCDEGGEHFWREKRAEVLACGRPWAAAARRRFCRGGRSLYVGGGVAELPVAVAESLALGRTVTLANLRESEVEVLRTALAQCGLDRIEVQARDGIELAGEMAWDHIGVVSVFTDPETWPVLSGLTYGHPAEVEPEGFVAEHRRATALADALVGGLSMPGWVTTTVEEVRWILRAASQAGLAVEADEEMLESPLVGDPIGFLALRAAPPTGSRSRSEPSRR